MSITHKKKVVFYKKIILNKYLAYFIESDITTMNGIFNEIPTAKKKYSMSIKTILLIIETKGKNILRRNNMMTP